MIQSTNSLQNLLPESRYLRLSGFGSPLDIGLIIRHIGDAALIRLFNECRGPFLRLFFHTDVSQKSSHL